MSQEQVMAQLRILIPAICTALTAFGVSATQAGSYQQIAMASLAPISYVIVAIWSLIHNTEANRVKSAASVTGVQNVAINAQASPAVAQVAMDNTIPKVTPTDADKAKVAIKAAT